MREAHRYLEIILAISPFRREQQMLALGRALGGGPCLLLLDARSMGLATLPIEEPAAKIADNPDVTHLGGH